MVQAILVPEMETEGVEANVALVEDGRPEKKEQVDPRLNQELTERDGPKIGGIEEQRGKSRGNPSSGPGWTLKQAEESKGHSSLHWISPDRHIEFTRYTPARKFEKLREKNGHDEVEAWKEYRKFGGNTYVVCPHQYDQPNTHQYNQPGTIPNEITPPRLADPLPPLIMRRSQETLGAIRGLMPSSSVKRETAASKERLVPQAKTGGAGANDALVEVEHPEKEASTGEEE